MKLLAEGKTVNLNPAMSRWMLPLIIFFIFVCWRGAVFTLTHPNYNHDAHNYEELYRGTVARELAIGTDLPIWEYRADDYAGGFYPIVTILPFFFYLFGFSMLALKSFSIVHTALTMLIWFTIIDRLASRRTAVLFSFIFTAAPFTYIKLSSTVLGDHAETCFLSALSVLVFFRAISYEGQKRIFACFTLGILSGFSLWFAYIYGFTLAAIFLYSIIHRKSLRLTFHMLAVFFAGFAIGFTPWIIFNIMRDFSGLIVYGVPIWHLFDVSMLNSWDGFFPVRLLSNESISIFNFHLKEYLALLYWIVFSLLVAAAAVRVLNKNKRLEGPAGLSLLYLFLYFSVQLFVSPAGFRFLVPVYPFAVVLAADMLNRLLIKQFRAGVLAAGCLIALGLLTCAFRFEPRFAGHYLNAKGYTVKILGYDPEALPRIKEGLSENFSKLRASDKTGYVIALARQLTLLESPQSHDIYNMVQLVPLKFRPFYSFSVGRELMKLYMDPVKAYDIIHPLENSHPEIYEFAVRGIFSAMSLINDPSLNVAQIHKKLPPHVAYRTAAYEGYQFSNHQLDADPDIKKFAARLLQEVQNFDPERRNRFVWGAGRQLFKRWHDDPRRSAFDPQDIKEYFAPVKQPLYQGIAAQMLRKHLYLYGSSLPWDWQDFFSRLDESERHDLVEGLKFIAARWGLPEEGIPFEKLKKIEAFW